MTNRAQWFRYTPADRRKRVAELHGKGLKNIVIARRLGISDVTVGQDLLFLGLRKPKQTVTTDLPGPVSESPVFGGDRAGEPAASLADIYAAQVGVDVAELMTPHGLARLDQVSLQALFLDGLTPSQRGAMTGKTAAFTFAELSTDTLIAAILRHYRKTPAPAYPRVPGTGSAPTRPPIGGAPAGAAGVVEGPGRPAPPDLGTDGDGSDTGDAARPEPPAAVAS